MCILHLTLGSIYGEYDHSNNSKNKRENMERERKEKLELFAYRLTIENSSYLF